MTNNLKFTHKILLAASLVVVIAFSAFAFFNAHQQRKTIEENLDRSLVEMGKAAADSIAYWLSGRISLVESESQALARDSSPHVLAGLLGQQIYLSSFLSTYLGEPDGTYTSGPPMPPRPDYDPRKRPWYVAAAGAGKTVLIPPYMFPSTGQLGITIATPLIKDGQFAGVVAGDLSLKTLVKIITSLDIGGLGEAFLVDDEGKVLVSQDESQVMKNLSDIYPVQPPRIGTAIHETMLGDQARLVSFTPVEGLPSVKWYIGLSIDKKKAFAALDESRNFAMIATLVAVVLIVLLLGLLIHALLKPLRTLTIAMEDIAAGDGDLTRRLQHDNHDEFAELATAFNNFVDRIHSSISAVASCARELGDSTRQVVAASHSSLRQSDEQAQRTNSVAAAINELGAAAQEIANNAAYASKQASNAREQAGDGRKVVSNAVQAMSDLSGKIASASANIELLDSRTVDIGKILEVIRGISEQTNLLALNAAIEAARAGEAGRGFAVVADEVRNLAHRTQDSAKEIQQMIGGLQIGSREAVGFMMESQHFSGESVSIAQLAGNRLDSVNASIGDIDNMNQSVAAATEEQTAVIETLNSDITEIDLLNRRSVDNLQFTLHACQTLEQQAERLQSLVNNFRL